MTKRRVRLLERRSRRDKPRGPRVSERTRHLERDGAAPRREPTRARKPRPSRAEARPTLALRPSLLTRLVALFTRR